MTKLTILASSAALLLLWALPGCGDDHAHDDHDEAPDKHEAHGDHDEGGHEHGDHADGDHADGGHEHGDHEHGDHDHGDAPKLSAEDAALAKAQKMCPVSDQALDAMGGAIKVMHDGRAVFLCCSGCEKKFLANPEKFLKKLDG